MKNIIPIERASEETIKKLIEIGILYLDDDGLHVSDREKANG